MKMPSELNKLPANQLPPDVIQVILNPDLRLQTLLKGATDKVFCQSVPIYQYYVHIHKLYEMGQIYAQKNNLEKAICCFLRFASVALEDIPQHKDYSLYRPAQDLKGRTMNNVVEALKFVEDAKTKLLDVYWKQADALKSDLNGNKSCRNKIPHCSGVDHDIVMNEQKEPSEHDQGSSGGSCVCSSRQNTPNEEETTVLLPIDLPDDAVRNFLQEASANQQQEASNSTLAFFYGHKNETSFEVTHLIFPQEIPLAERSKIVVPSEMSKILAENELEAIGWIHIHSRGEPYMSSTDLHDHFPYQRRTESAFAIICNINDGKEISYFRMTRRGMKAIERCKTAGKTHNHCQGAGPLYEAATHINITKEKTITVLDFRNRIKPIDKEKEKEKENIANPVPPEDKPPSPRKRKIDTVSRHSTKMKIPKEDKVVEKPIEEAVAEPVVQPVIEPDVIVLDASPAPETSFADPVPQEVPLQTPFRNLHEEVVAATVAQIAIPQPLPPALYPPILKPVSDPGLLSLLSTFPADILSKILPGMRQQAAAGLAPPLNTFDINATSSAHLPPPLPPLSAPAIPRIIPFAYRPVIDPSRPPIVIGEQMIIFDLQTGCPVLVPLNYPHN